MPRYASLLERLYQNSVNVSAVKNLPDECLIWTGYCQCVYVTERGTQGSYGKINLTRDGRSLKFPVHRVAKVLEEILTLMSGFDFYNPLHKKIFFELYYAYSACGLSIEHLCCNTLCINPSHLEWVTLSENQKRKKWDWRKRSKRILEQQKGVTRYYRSLELTPNILAWIRSIKKKAYRKKK